PAAITVSQMHSDRPAWIRADVDGNSLRARRGACRWRNSNALPIPASTRASLRRISELSSSGVASAANRAKPLPSWSSSPAAARPLSQRYRGASGRARATPSRRRSRISMAPSRRTRPSRCSRLASGYNRADSRIRTPNAESSRAPASGAAHSMSTQFDGPAVDDDAFGPQLGGAVPAGIADDGHGLAGLQVALGQAATFQPRKRGQHHAPFPALVLDGQLGMGVAVAQLADFGFHGQGLLAVIGAPAVMRQGQWGAGQGQQQEQQADHDKASWWTGQETLGNAGNFGQLQRGEASRRATHWRYSKPSTTSRERAKGSNR